MVPYNLRALLFSDVHQLRFDCDAIHQISEFFVGMVEIDGIAFAVMWIADSVGQKRSTTDMRILICRTSVGPMPLNR